MGKTGEDRYSVLMSVYEKEKPEYLRQSLSSMLRQTLPFSDFVLVCDGPLTPGLEEVIRWAAEEMGGRLHCVRLPENMGLGRALRVGVSHCKSPVIARMDSDDISCPKRCELQMRAMREHGCDIVGGTLQEFADVPGDLNVRRVSPRTHEEILRYIGKRNPFNHPCVMYRRDAVLRAGNYRDFPWFEDYALWVRMLKGGCRGYNLPEVILDMRTGNGMYQRRGGRKYAAAAVRFQRYLRYQGMIGPVRCLCNCAVRMTVSLMPGFLRQGFYGHFLRKR